MKILALSGSGSQESINHHLLGAVLKGLPADWEVEVRRVSELDIPLFTRDREKLGTPEPILELARAIAAADGFIMASPEHNGSVPAALKNVIDWCSRSEFGPSFVDGAKTLLLSTSPGGNGARTNLEALAKLMPRWGSEMVGRFSLSSFGDNFDTAEGRITNGEAQAELDALLAKFVAALA